METSTIVLIVVLAVILVVLAALTLTQGRRRSVEHRREQAERTRAESEEIRRNADEHAAEADELAARARRQRITADETDDAARVLREQAEHEGADAAHRKDRAADLDPGVSDGADGAEPGPPDDARNGHHRRV